MSTTPVQNMRKITQGIKKDLLKMKLYIPSKFTIASSLALRKKI